jgi:aspartyl/glutamyl-tRNA(Asn/Gln) amidotransferase C subunit
MSKFTKEMVNKYAEELLIGLSDEENKNVLDEFEIIDKTCEIVSKIPNIENVEPMTHCLDEYITDLRKDESEESISIDDALRNSDDVFAREIELPKVVG